MAASERRKILSNVTADEFIGRSNELDIILRHAKGAAWENGIIFLSAPGAGLSELLTQSFDQLFYEQGEIIPIYFRFHTTDRSISQVASRFLSSFIRQVAAFRKNNPSIILSAAEVGELKRSFDPRDLDWIDPLIDICDSEDRQNDDIDFFRLAFSAPARAAQFGVRIFVMIDDLDRADCCRDDRINLIEELKMLYARSSRFLLGGRRRALFNAVQTGERVLDQVRLVGLQPLSFADSGLLIEQFATHLELNLSEQARDLIVHQLRGMPVWLRGLIATAGRYRRNLDSYKDVESTYLEAVGSGTLHGWFDTVMNEIVSDPEAQMTLIELLYDLIHAGRDRDPVRAWKRHFKMSDKEFTRMITLLNQNEFINTTSNIVQADNENLPLRDYVDIRYRLEVRRDPRSLVMGSCLADFLKRAPIEMAGFYKKGAVLGVRDLLESFDCQEVPRGLLDYGIFKRKYKGNDDDEILKKASEEENLVALPQIVYTANTVSLYSPIGKFAQKDESAVALGFESANYRDENEVVWIAAEVNSKLEVDAEQTNFWCDRLEMVAVMCGFERCQLWLISPEGFDQNAQEVLRARRVFGSSREQAILLAKSIHSDDRLNKIVSANEYEIVLPMGDDTELIAAFAVEEIAKKHHFEPKAINQIKTALVEASINANEHSKSNERKIYQRFVVDDEKLTITVSNRGLKFDGQGAEVSELGEGRRGWGLNLIKKLMDEVQFEHVDDGTRITMVKFLKPVSKKDAPVAAAATNGTQKSASQ